MKNLDILPPKLQIAFSRGRTDPVIFAEELLGMPLHDGQKKYLRESTADINLLVSGNRWGKSVTIAIKHIWKCFYKHGINPGNSAAHLKAIYRTANLSPDSKQLDSVFNAIRAIMTSSFAIPQPDGTLKSNDCALGFLYNPKNVRTSGRMRISFNNNSYINFASTGEDKGSSINADPYGYISFDEGGRDFHMQEVLESNVLPRLTDLDGQLDIPCTPNESSPSIFYHHDLFVRGIDPDDPVIYSQEGSIYENTFLTRERIAKLEARYAKSSKRDQVLFGKFLFGGDSIYSKEMIDNAKDDSLNAGVPYEYAHKYVFGIDTAIGSDEFVITVIDATTDVKRLVKQVAFQGKSKSPDLQIWELVKLFEEYSVYGDVRILLETWNGESAGFYGMLPDNIKRCTACWGAWQPPGLPVEYARKMKTLKKELIIMAPLKLMSNKMLKIPNEPTLIKQLSIYKEDDKRIATDRVISLALACWMATDGAPSNSRLVMEQVEGW